jgi:hypothetical protein
MGEVVGVVWSAVAHAILGGCIGIGVIRAGVLANPCAVISKRPRRTARHADPSSDVLELRADQTVLHAGVCPVFSEETGVGGTDRDA